MSHVVVKKEAGVTSLGVMLPSTEAMAQGTVYAKPEDSQYEELTVSTHGSTVSLAVDDVPALIEFCQDYLKHIEQRDYPDGVPEVTELTEADIEKMIAQA